MRSLAPCTLLLLAVACATTQAPPPPVATPTLPDMEPPAAPPLGWHSVSRAYALMDRREFAQALVQYQQAWFEGNRKPNTAYDAACAAAKLMRKSEAMTWLERAVENGFRDALGMREDPDLMPLRADPAFNDLLARILKLPPSIQEAGANRELLKLVAEDQADRRNLPESPPPEAMKQLLERDRQRRQRVNELVASGAVHTGADFHAAALVFQHGTTLEDFARARELAAEAASKGHPAALRLTALAWDRWLMMAGKPQRFGTQYLSDDTGRMRLYPVDPSITDAERARWGIPPLSEIPQSM